MHACQKWPDLSFNKIQKNAFLKENPHLPVQMGGPIHQNSNLVYCYYSYIPPNARYNSIDPKNNSLLLSASASSASNTLRCAIITSR
ncbi:hypothetical protein SAMN05661012_04417 [Chitinophaga sancti]|uniref:Uncharacterized protein n=1 Tax=Chitinophaga sancti TaxID=1004 RepID=A0A1K1RXN7_9BACT|nr:hypothetical protein SAMN05661012_04417 [Chitinophaga sancti]